MMRPDLRDSDKRAAAAPAFRAVQDTLSAVLNKSVSDGSNRYELAEYLKLRSLNMIMDPSTSGERCDQALNLSVRPG